ncbi:MAG: nucleotidyltransferase family protein [Clostridia bacterium]|nr:nucleotidyltransferase family protein [Clostridia bacterium]
MDLNRQEFSPGKVLGIVAEYDPFHRGHERHLRLAKEQVRPDFTYVVLSGCVKQRGELAMLSPYDRARCALAAGADAVFALPAAWTVRDAEHYALGAVILLQRLGITHLAFGAEAESLEVMGRIAELLENPTDSFQQALHRGLKAGTGYPRAVSQALERINPAWAEIMNQPNNILAICYLRAILRLDAHIQPVLIPRQGGYHADRIDPEQPSASVLRGALERGNYWPTYQAMTAESARLLRKAILNSALPRREALDTLLIGRLRSMTREDIQALPYVSEGLEDLIFSAARKVQTREQLLDMASGKRYPKARISRICAWALLGLKAEELEAERLPEHAILLSLRDKPEMTALWRNKKNLITTSWTNETDIKAWQLWAQCANLPDVYPWKEKVVRL